jgi:hypothetical protein
MYRGLEQEIYDYLEKREERKRKIVFVITTVTTLLFVSLAKLLWPDLIPFKLFEFWALKKPLGRAILASWPLLAWSVLINTVIVIINRNDPETNRNAEKFLSNGFEISIWAGVSEEIAFRWLLFYSQIIGYKIVNWLFFGFAGFGIFEWLYLHITGPIANFLTLGFLEPILLNGIGWAVGAAILSSNGKFRDGHAYQGILGWINAWFTGMFFFYLMFNYSLFASIVVHFLYDIFIFIVVYIDAAIERKTGWG